MFFRKRLGCFVVAALLSSFGFAKGTAVVPTVIPAASSESGRPSLHDHRTAFPEIRRALEPLPRNDPETAASAIRLAGPKDVYCRP